jgi:hypothetical protein
LAAGLPLGFDGTFTVAGIMAEQARGNFWIYVWLGISGLLNLSGMASIVDGFVTWAKFFHDIIDVYRSVIRQPLAWIGHLIWPFSPIPAWVFDVFVIWAAFILATNIWYYKENEATLLKQIREDFRDGGFKKGVWGVIVIILLPLLIIISIFLHPEFRYGIYKTLLNFLLIFATFTLLLFINWQILRIYGG